MRDRYTVIAKQKSSYKRLAVITLLGVFIAATALWLILTQRDFAAQTIGNYISKLKSDEQSQSIGSTIASDNLGIAAGGSLQYLPETKTKMYFELLNELNVKHVRFDFAWSDIQSRDADTFAWGKYDKIVEYANLYDVQVLGMIGYTPEWARTVGCNHTDKCEPASPATYAKFVSQVVQRYSSKGVYNWELWNEPNNINFWKPAPDAEKYTKMLKLSYEAIMNIDESINIISGGLSPATNDNKNIAPVNFVERMYEAGAKDHFNILGYHPYCYEEDFDCPNEYATWSAWSQMDDTPVSVRSIMEKYNDSAKKVWITEFGSPTRGNRSVSEDKQADMLVESYESFSLKDWAGPIFWYSMQDTGGSHSDPENWFGLVRPDGSKKPSFYAYTSLLEHK